MIWDNLLYEKITCLDSKYRWSVTDAYDTMEDQNLKRIFSSSMNKAKPEREIFSCNILFLTESFFKVLPTKPKKFQIIDVLS